MKFAKQIELDKKNGDKYVLFNRLVFPIIYSDVQIGASLRRTKSSDYPKWSHQPANIDTGKILYNYDNAKHSSKIVEGITDVWAYHEIGVDAVATFGAHLTKDQYKLLLTTGADIILSYDGDDAGRLANQKAKDMLKNKANVKEVIFNQGNDPEKYK